MLGTLWLVLGGTGAAVIAAIFLSDFQDGIVSTGIGFLGVSLAFGLTVVTAAYAMRGTLRSLRATRRRRNRPPLPPPP